MVGKIGTFFLATVVIATAVATLTVPAVAAGTGHSASFVKDGYPASFTQDEVRIRSAPRLNASILGLGYRDHQVTVWCVDVGDMVEDGDNRSLYWWRLTDRTTGAHGYSSLVYVYVDNPGVPDCS
ncbi:hypothetical protein ACFYOT_41295 [Saccharothrix saharensis]|uniref:hypothetical protein n=1 Tax=Saccharothrix saharensis TaxID=571190 RepID=UPI0036846485